jgi:M6 family metalloprotease-like protein
MLREGHRMNVRSAHALALALLVTTAARADDARPAREAETVDLPPSVGERMRGLASLVGRSSRLGRELVPPSSGRFRLAVVLVELADSPRAPFPRSTWERELFSRGEPEAPGFCGSVADFYREQTGDRLSIEGTVFDWVRVGAKRAELEPQPTFSITGRRTLFSAALDALLAREGRRALDGFDALSFVVAGPAASRGTSILWSHSSLLVHRGRPWRYYITHSGVERAEPMGVHAHELGHVLGLPDEYGIGPRSGSSIFCLMSVGNYGTTVGGWLPIDAPRLSPLAALERLIPGKIEESLEDLRRALGGRRAPELATGSARPLHVCAPCKLALGWSRPIVVDPTVRQRLYLEPVETRPDDVIVVPLDRCGDERLVLEYRGKRGFDRDLPRSGLLAWRTGIAASGLSRLALGASGEIVPAHGIRSVDAAWRGPDGVLFPFGDKRDFTVRGRSVTVRVSGIEEKDGRLYLEVGPD